MGRVGIEGIVVGSRGLTTFRSSRYPIAVRGVPNDNEPTNTKPSAKKITCDKTKFTKPQCLSSPASTLVVGLFPLAADQSGERWTW